MVSGGRATALQAVHGAPEGEAESFHAVGHGYVPEAAAGYVPRQSEGGSFPPILQMGAAVGQPPQPVEATQEHLKNKSVEEPLPQIRRFLRGFRKLMQEPARRKGHVVSDAEAGVRAVQPRDPKYGRFQLNERFNSDQVPLPFVNGQSETWAPKGSKRVSIAQPFSGLEKRQCKIQPTIGPGGKLMQCVIIFRGTGKRISKVEKKANDPRVDVFFQKNAWADSDFCMAWAKRGFRKSLMQGGGGVPVEESLLTLDNLHGQTTEKFKAYKKKECNTLVWHYPGGCTGALQPIDAGLGALIKVEVGKQLDIWLENGDNLERWESNALTASDRRVLLTKWVATAVDIVDNRPNYRFRLFEKTGGLMTADGTCDDRINLEGLTEPLAFMRNRGENEAGGGGLGGGEMRAAGRKVEEGSRTRTRTVRRKTRTAQKKVAVNEFNLLQLLCFCF